ncbi:patatin-like phospholipase family protein [Microcoleus sp. FACHB-1515]|uniref:patatin-like phospholipase family protein n=1 Tax=Cyanophyceae TaxID=3028117 RepID=UPI0016869BBC|nr:patatin-like phospholipase family protein [Microcoleus sp. FACHB-1515]MBD2093435.1 patatin-like phospholipase family protein [Microcoleus sp. FACHB-1515]
MTRTDDRERAYVVFQGGGALGVAHFGAWQAIARDFEIIGVAGTSSGAIVAALCAAGVTPNKTFESFKLNLPKIVGHKGFLWSLIDVVCRTLFGRDAANDGNRFQRWLEQQFEQSELKKGEITFEELYQRNRIYLEVVACDLKDGDTNSIVFSPDIRKNISVPRAVRASISLPGIFKTLRIGNREFVDGGLKLNFPIETLYQKAKSANCVLIGVRFRKSPRSFNSSNIWQVFSKSYELVMSNSSPVTQEVKSYPKCKIIEIDDQGLNPLNFKLSEEQLEKLRQVGREAAEEQLEELQTRLQEVKSRLRSQLHPDFRESVDQVQNWFTHEALPEVEAHCKRTLGKEEFADLEIDDYKIKRLCWEIEKYLERVSESFLDQDYDLLTDRLLRPSLPNLSIYSEVLDLVKSNIPEYLAEREEVVQRIIYIRNAILKGD